VRRVSTAASAEHRPGPALADQAFRSSRLEALLQQASTQELAYSDFLDQ